MGAMLMTEPIFDESTERTYDRLPGVYKFEDTNHDWTMKRYLSGACKALFELDTLITRFRYTPPEDGYLEEVDLHSDLVDPVTADASWLPWLSQLVGVHSEQLLTEAAQRDRIAQAFDGARPGTKSAIIQAAQTVLTGTKTVYVYQFSNDTSGINGGTEWEILILTLSDETAGDVIAAVTNLGAKPAGVKLYHDNYGADWDTVEANLPTWDDWEATTWQDLEQQS
jgi:hypothetical protein